MMFKKELKNINIENGLNLNSREYFRLLFEYAPDAYYINDLEGNFLGINKETERITGYRRKELIGKNYFNLDLLDEKGMVQAREAISQNKKGLSTGPDEYTLYRKDKSTVIVEISTYPIKLGDKHVVLGIARDITERKKVEQAYKEAQEKYRVLLPSNARRQR